MGRQPPLPTIKTCCSILFIVNALTKLYKIFILNFDVFIFLNICLPLSLVALVHHLPSPTLLLCFIVILKEKKIKIFLKIIIKHILTYLYQIVFIFLYFLKRKRVIMKEFPYIYCEGLWPIIIIENDKFGFRLGK